jgi:formylglycine-generating enzyme required for sulfatase activity
VSWKRKKQQGIFSCLGDIQFDDSQGEAAKDVLSIKTGGELNGGIFPSEPVPVVDQTCAPPPFPESPVSDSLGMFFIELPPGTFLMGSPDHEPGRNEDETPHQVTLTRAFFIQSTPVTQSQWKQVMGTEPACFKGKADECPVEGVSWAECQGFIKKLSSAGEYSYRLPTEAEWEYACRAGTEAPFCSGEIEEVYCAMDPALDAVGWYCGNSGRRTHSVAQKDPNPWGLYDMHGNVSEWCSDWYGPCAESPVTDPAGPDSGRGRVVRAGSWFSSAKNCGSASRFWWPPKASGDTIGFRLVREPKRSI